MEHKIDTSGRSVDTSVTKVSGRPLDAFHDRVPRQTDGIFSLVCARIALVSAQALFFFVLVLVVVVVVVVAVVVAVYFRCARGTINDKPTR